MRPLLSIDSEECTVGDSARLHPSLDASSHPSGCGHRQQAVSLFHGQPVSKANANPTHALHASNACGQFRTEQARIRGFEGDSPYGRKPRVDRRRRIVLPFEKDSVSENNGSVERKSAF
jgi:hypothetical protein